MDNIKIIKIDIHEILMDIGYLRHFLAVAEELHFGQAARRLNMEQAPLSQSIRRFEERLGVTLFERSRRGGTRLSEAGLRLLPEAQRAVQQFEAALRSVQGDPAPSPTQLRVGFVTMGLLNLLPAAIRAMATSHPHVSVRLIEGGTSALLGRLAQGGIDLALVHPVDRPAQGLGLSLLREDKIVAAVPTSHPYAGRSRVSLRDLATEPLVFFPPDSSPMLHAQIRSAFSALGLTPRIEQEARATPTMLLMVAAGFGYALMPESARLLPFSNVSFVTVSDMPQALRWSIALARRLEPSGDVVDAFAAVLQGKST